MLLFADSEHEQARLGLPAWEATAGDNPTHERVKSVPKSRARIEGGKPTRLHGVQVLRKEHNATCRTKVADHTESFPSEPAQRSSYGHTMAGRNRLPCPCAHMPQFHELSRGRGLPEPAVRSRERLQLNGALAGCAADACCLWTVTGA